MPPPNAPSPASTGTISRTGHYNCVGCGTPLFEADTKFDAGCGWPSYWAPINSEVVERVVDKQPWHGARRSALQQMRLAPRPCVPDGPEPTGERFCINSAAIDFKAHPDRLRRPPQGGLANRGKAWLRGSPR
jgi:peptide methionine sulfoxide reductase MsrB